MNLGEVAIEDDRAHQFNLLYILYFAHLGKRIEDKNGFMVGEGYCHFDEAGTANISRDIVFFSVGHENRVEILDNINKL